MTHWQPIAPFALAASFGQGVSPVIASAAAPTQAVAAEGKPVPAETGDGAAISTQRAREHYARAVSLYDAGDLDRALDEFERAQALRPSPQILFNMAQVQIRLQRYASAHRTLSRYLQEGGDALSVQRRKEVDAQLAFLEQKTARLSVRLNLPGAGVEVQGRSVGVSPLSEHVLVDSGRVTVRASKAEYESVEYQAHVDAGQEVAIGLSLTPIAGAHALRDVPRVPDRSLTRVVWISTGATFALGAAGTGLATLLTSRHYDDLRRRPSTPPDASATRRRLDRQRDLVESLAITTDVLTVAAVGAAAVALYLELAIDADEAPTAISLHLAPRGFRLTGSF